MRSGAFFCVRDLSAAQARDGAGCRVSIAGKPAPTGNGCSAGLVGDGLPGMGRVAGSASPASRLPQVLGAVQARDGAGCRVSIAGKPAPTGNGCSAGLVGAGLPGMGRVAESASPASRLPQVSGAAQARDGAGCRIIIAGKPAPTGNGCSAGLVGAGLPAMGQVAGLSSPQAAPSG